MDLNVNVYHHFPTGVGGLMAKLVSIDAKLDAIIEKEIDMTVAVDNLAAKVAANTTVTQSAITLLNGLGAQIEALKNDPVALQALADTLASDDAGLAAAITANTPAAPGGGATGATGGTGATGATGAGTVGVI